MALSGATKPSPQVIGAAFVQQYYYVLHKSPDQVHKFYQDSSILSRPDPSGMMISVTMMQASNDKLLSFNFSNYIAEIESVDAQASHKDGILVVVTGTLTRRNNFRHKFVQSFFLAPQESGGYVVLNDIFRFVDPSRPKEVNQEILLNDTNHDASAAALTPESECVFVSEPLADNAIEHEVALSVEDPDTGDDAGDEIHKPPENGCSEVEDDAATDTDVRLSQSDDQPTSDVTASMSQEDGPKKSYASIVKVYKGSSSPVPVSVSVSKPKAALPKVPPPKLASANPENQSVPSSMPSTSEVPVPSSNSAPKNNSSDAEGHSIYIRNLPLSTTPEQVMEEFKKFGPIKPDGVQVRNHKVERFCFGFVEFELQDSMLASIKASPLNIGGRPAYIEEKRTTTRVVNGVVTNCGNGGGRGRYQPGRGGYWNDNFRGRGGFGSQGYVRTEFRSRGEYSTRGHGGPGHPSSIYQQRPFQNGNGRMFRPHVANQTAVSA